ncbi:MAG TPA: hypothetical protein VGB44_05940 [Flavobacterium sp.]|jgi:plastocyanin
MKNIKYIFSLFLLTTVLGCSEDENGTGFIDDVSAPTNLSALFTITQDNTGLVTIIPNGEGVTQYTVNFGDNTAAEAIVNPGDAVEHVYAEGVYSVAITAMGINGLETVYTQPLEVTFVQPINFAIDVNAQVGNPYQINLSAEADYETYFDVFWGDEEGETGESFNQGQTVSHTYTSTGTYEITVIAYSGGVATSTETETVTIFDPVVLPITFESATLNYSFGDFGNASTSVVNNPSISGQNVSAEVGKLTKNVGAEVWAGTSFALDQVIDFSVMQQMTIKTYSPVVGAVVKLKLENLTNAAINVEVDAVTTVANQWETLTFDFTGINNANNYQRIVLFYDFGNAGNGTSLHFDDIMQTSGEPQLILPVTFQDNALTYSFISFGGANANAAANPNQTGINTSSMVGSLTKPNGAEVWAGAVLALDQPINFSALQKIKMKVWSPQAGVTVLLKLENAASSTIFVEVPATTTVANQWEELTFDFTGINNSNNYQNLVLFFGFGSPGNGATYYFDDIQLSN